MKAYKLFLISVCCFVLTQFALGQGFGQEKGIPGFLDPHARTFTTKTQTVAPKMDSAPSGTAVLFREQFNITITNYDQTSNVVGCKAEIDEFGDPVGDYSDSANVIATQKGSTFTCDIPLLQSWTLSDPGSDSIVACVSVNFLAGITIGPASTTYDSRSESPACLTLPIPSNGTTVTNTFSLTM